MPDTFRCPHCRAGFPSAEKFDGHLRGHPLCRAYASLARSLASIGVRLCPRCRLAMPLAAYVRWSTDGFVHQNCLSDAERRDGTVTRTATAVSDSPAPIRHN